MSEQTNSFSSFFLLNIIIPKLNSLWKSESVNHSVMSNSLQPHGLLCPWNSPGKNTGVGCHSLLLEIIILWCPKVMLTGLENPVCTQVVSESLLPGEKWLPGPVSPSRKIPCGGVFFQLTRKQSPAQEDVGGKRKRSRSFWLVPWGRPPCSKKWLLANDVSVTVFHGVSNGNNNKRSIYVIFLWSSGGGQLGSLAIWVPRIRSYRRK